MTTSQFVRRITGGPIFAQTVSFPEGYALCPDGTNFAPGRIGSGPFAGNETTVCLLPGDDGEWFKKQVEAHGGHWKAIEILENGGNNGSD